MKRFPSISIVALTAFIAGCASLCDIRDPKTGQPIPPDFRGTTGNLEVRKALVEPAVLDSVQTIPCSGFDRVVFTFRGSRTPGYRTEYVDKPIHDCGAGNVIPVAGNGWLQVQLSQSQAHTDAGQPTVRERNRMLNQPNLKQLVDTCDFEGEVIWVLGLASPNRYRVVELTNPPRLVVDVKH
jgi:hypothetical protein